MTQKLLWNYTSGKNLQAAKYGLFDSAAIMYLEFKLQIQIALVIFNN